MQQKDIQFYTKLSKHARNEKLNMYENILLELCLGINIATQRVMIVNLIYYIAISIVRIIIYYFVECNVT